MIKYLALIFLLADPASAAVNPYQSTIISTGPGTAVMNVSGYIKVAASSSTPSTYTITLDGTQGSITASSGTFTSSGATRYSLNLSSGIYAPTGTFVAGMFVGDGSRISNVAAASFSTAATISASQITGTIQPAQLVSTVAYKSVNNNFTASQTISGGVSAATGTFTGTGTGLSVTNGLSAGSATISGSLTASSATLTASGANQYSLQLSSGINATAGTINAGMFVGDGSRLTNVFATSLSTALSINASSVTPGSFQSGTYTFPDIVRASTIIVTGNSFQVGQSTIIAKDGFVGIGTVGGAHRLHVLGFPTGVANASLMVESANTTNSSLVRFKNNGTQPPLAWWESVNAEWAAGNDTTGNFVIRSNGVGSDPASGNTRFTFTNASWLGLGDGITPSTNLDILGLGGEILIGGTLGTYNGIGLAGSIGVSDYNFLSAAADKSLYINRPLGFTIKFRENNTEQMTLATGGSLGIGTTAPVGRVNVSSSPNTGGSNDAGNIFADRYSDDNFGSGYIGRKSRGTSASPTGALINDRLGFIEGRALEADTVGFSTHSMGRFSMHTATNTTSTNHATYFLWSHAPLGSTTIRETMRLTSQGSLGIGTTAPDSILEAAGNIHADGAIIASSGSFILNSNTVAAITASSGILISSGGLCWGSLQNCQYGPSSGTTAGSSSFNGGTITTSLVETATTTTTGFVLTGSTGQINNVLAFRSLTSSPTYVQGGLFYSSPALNGAGALYLGTNNQWVRLSTSGVFVALSSGSSGGGTTPGDCTGSGGIVSTAAVDGNIWCVHDFFTSSTFNRPTSTTSVKACPVGGGGAGNATGGAGAGGAFCTQFDMSAGVSTGVIVGPGGVGSSSLGANDATDGSPSFFGSTRAYGGARSPDQNSAGINGGSGSGASGWGGGTCGGFSTPDSCPGGAGTAGQGNYGGHTLLNALNAGGGGGGASTSTFVGASTATAAGTGGDSNGTVAGNGGYGFRVGVHGYAECWAGGGAGSVRAGGTAGVSITGCGGGTGSVEGSGNPGIDGTGGAASGLSTIIVSGKNGGNGRVTVTYPMQ